MNISTVIMTGVLMLTLISPFGIYYGARVARQMEFRKHRRIQNIIYIICFIGVLFLEGLIRFSGGSGSIASQSAYYGTSLFNFTLTSHIIVAVITYLLWTYQVIQSNLKFRKTLPGRLSISHRKMGYIILYGLIYTAITALIIYLMTLNLV